MAWWAKIAAALGRWAWSHPVAVAVVGVVAIATGVWYEKQKYWGHEFISTLLYGGGAFLLKGGITTYATKAVWKGYRNWFKRLLIHALTGAPGA